VTLDLAAGADLHAALDFDERPNPGVVADLAAVEIRERLDDHVVSELDVVDEARLGSVDWPGGHPRRIGAPR